MENQILLEVNCLIARVIARMIIRWAKQLNAKSISFSREYMHVIAYGCRKKSIKKKKLYFLKKECIFMFIAEIDELCGKYGQFDMRGNLYHWTLR